MVEAIAKPAQAGTGGRGTTEKAIDRTHMENLTTAAIVDELERFIVVQIDSKLSVAVALRNRFRRQMLPDELRQEIQPKNILMIGPTGVGKTEIARRVAKIVDAPFIKVEATKFTEVGYVGRDVESIVRDLVEIAISNLHGQRLEQVKDEAARTAAQRLVELLADQQLSKKPVRVGRKAQADGDELSDEGEIHRQEVATKRRLQREQKRLLLLLNSDALEEETVEIEIEPEEFVDEYNPLDFVAGMTPDDLYDTFQDFLGGLTPRRPTRRRVSVREARRILTQQEANRLVDIDAVIDEAIQRVEEASVVFLDEIDKTISSSEYGADVSGEGVQRDLLPIVEGSVVMTRYGAVKTDHVLFIAAGAFHNTRPSDLIPELQGRFPIRVELNSLTEDDLFAILTEPQNALTKQYQALLGTEGLALEFTQDGMREMARLATEVNARTEDIGARRLHTIVEKVIEEISFDAQNYSGQTVTIDRTFVAERVGEVAADDDLSNFIL